MFLGHFYTGTATGERMQMKAAELHNVASQVKQGRKISMMIYSTARTTGSEIMTLCLTLIAVFELLLAVITPVLHYVTWYYFHYVQPYNYNDTECPETFHSDDRVTFREALLFIFTPYSSSQAQVCC